MAQEGRRPPTSVVPAGEDLTPVTIVTGCLGSGKTTLLNDILRRKGAKRVAVIENEFGEINIDDSLVTANLAEKEDLVSLNNGCVCCSLRKDIIRALATLDKRSTSLGQRFDAILLETTGLADPAPVAFTFFANRWIAERFKLDSILCVVDARYTAQHLDALATDADFVNEATQQLAFADLVLVNKIDLVSDEELKQVKDSIHKINANAALVEVQLNKPDTEGDEGRIPLEKILGTESFSLERALQIDPGFMDSASEPESDVEPFERAPSSSPSDDEDSKPSVSGKDSPVGRDSSESAQEESPGSSKRSRDSQDDESLAEDKHRPKRPRLLPRRSSRAPKRRRLLMHDGMGIYSVGITAIGPLHEWRFNMFMRDFFSERHRDIFRCKGVLSIKGHDDTKFVFQGVHDKITYGPAKENWYEGEERINRVVFIGKNLNRKALTEAFRSCVWTPLPPGWTEHYREGERSPYYLHESGKIQKESPMMACARVRTTDLVGLNQPKELQPKQSQEVSVS
ncbi:hypothetical protein BSKO_09090 [Bryopsis sp. KO-2023]|nr:hypothetical protein BSKO_09090 [Bryopsis sp. KO-2023]